MKYSLFVSNWLQASVFHRLFTFIFPAILTFLNIYFIIILAKVANIANIANI